MPRLHYLDGLRGWASLVVVFCHTLQVWVFSPENMAAHGAKPLLDAVNSTPFGALMDGQMAVYVFFAISGMALGYSIISAPSPRSALFNMALVRYPRLTIPISASCAISYVIFVSGGNHNVAAAALSDSAWLDSFFRFEPHAPDMLRFAFFDVFFRYDPTHSWNSVLWTMSIELIWSFALFALLVLPWRAVRIVAAIALAAFFREHAAFGFFAGYLLAEYVFAVRDVKAAHPLGQLLGWFALLAAVVLATALNWPNGGTLRQFLRSIGGRNLVAILLLSGATLTPIAQQLLSVPLSRFFGRISFSLYLLHLLVICSAASALYVYLEGKTPFAVQAGAVLALTVALSIGGARVFAAVFEEWALSGVKGVIARIVPRRPPTRVSATP